MLTALLHVYYNVFPRCVLDRASFPIACKLLGDDLGGHPEVSLHGTRLGEVVVRFNECQIVLANHDVNAFGVVGSNGAHAGIIRSFLV